MEWKDPVLIKLGGRRGNAADGIADIATVGDASCSSGDSADGCMEGCSAVEEGCKSGNNPGTAGCSTGTGDTSEQGDNPGG